MPDIKNYPLYFIQFLIQERPTRQQLITYIILHQMFEIGIPFHIIDEWNLIRIIHLYGTISSRTLEKQFISPNPIHKRLVGIYSSVKGNRNLIQNLFV